MLSYNPDLRAVRIDGLCVRFNGLILSDNKTEITNWAKESRIIPVFSEPYYSRSWSESLIGYQSISFFSSESAMLCFLRFA